MNTTWVKIGWAAKLAGVILLLAGLQAYSAPGRAERPIVEASLDEKNQSTNPLEAFPKPYHLFLNQRIGDRQTFTMHEDTGVRCVTTPCPSDRRAEFVVKSQLTLRDGSIRYTAREIIEAPMANVRLSARVLQVVDHRFSTAPVECESMWDVRLTSQDNEREFTGNPQPVPVVD